MCVCVCMYVCVCVVTSWMRTKHPPGSKVALHFHTCVRCLFVRPRFSNTQKLDHTILYNCIIIYRTLRVCRPR